MNTTSQTRSNIRFFAGFFFILFFVFSALSVIWFSRTLDRWIFIFYNTESHRMEREVRYLVPVKGREVSLNLMVKEILLGSFNPLYPPVWSRSTPLLSLFLDGDHLYVNVGGAILSGGSEGLIFLRRVIAENVNENFSFPLNKITLAVEGETWDESDASFALQNEQK